MDIWLKSWDTPLLELPVTGGAEACRRSTSSGGVAGAMVGFLRRVLIRSFTMTILRSDDSR
jgi:hypothetical protein